MISKYTDGVHPQLLLWGRQPSKIDCQCKLYSNLCKQVNGNTIGISKVKSGTLQENTI